MIGIYKITSPKNKVYIGQSVDINRRFREYKSRYYKLDNKLNRSFNKYGVDKHKFEVLIECSVSELNDLERYYQELYNAIKTGLNCILTKTSDRSGFLCDETKNKIGKKLKGRVYSDEYKANMSKVLKGRVFTEEWKNKLSEKAKERGVLPETIRKATEAARGRKMPEEQKRKISESLKGRDVNLEHIEFLTKIKKKKVICSKTKKVWDSAKECAIENNISLTHMWNMMNGHRKNTTTFSYLNYENIQRQ